MTQYGTPLILPKGERFRSCVKETLALWKRLHPDDVKVFLAAAKQAKDQLKRPSGKSDDKNDPVSKSITLPKWPVEILRCRPEQTEMKYGIRCGYGSRIWDADTDLQQIFVSELRECKLSNLEGAPARRGWS